MVKRARIGVFPALTAINLQPGTDESLFRQLYESVRQAILTGEMEAGSRLPSTRTLADELGISRNTVINAFDQLTAEGYLESRTGDGTYVAHTLPDELLHVAADGKSVPSPDRLSARRSPSRRGSMLAKTA